MGGIHFFLAIAAGALALAVSAGPAQAEGPSKCERLQAVFIDALKADAKACPEAKETQQRYRDSYPQALLECRKLEDRVKAGPPRLKQGTEDEMLNEVMEIRQRDITENQALIEKVSHSLLRTPIDADNPAAPPPALASDCTDEIENYVAVRRRVITALGELNRRIEEIDDGLHLQAVERGTRPIPVNQRSGR